MDWIESTPMRVIRSVILILASAYCLFFSVAGPMMAADVGDLERRVTAIEALNLEHRLTRLETVVDSVSVSSRGTMAGVGVLLVETVMRLGKKKKEDGDGS